MAAVTTSINAQGRREQQHPRREAEAVIEASQKLERELTIDRYDSVVVGCEPGDGSSPVITVTRFHESTPAGGVTRSSDHAELPFGAIPDVVEAVPASGGRPRRFPTEVRHRLIHRDYHDAMKNDQVIPTDHDPPENFTYNNEYEPLAGGSMVNDGCSLGAPAEDDDGNRYAISAGHCFDVGDTIYQPNASDGRQIGEVVESEFTGVGEYDASLIELDDDVAYDGELARPNDTVGQLTDVKSLIDIYMDISNDTLIPKRGARTGLTSGTAGGFISTGDGTFWVDANAYNGDSGGVSYEFDWQTGENIAAGTVSGPRASSMDDPPSDKEEDPWHQTIYTAYAVTEERFDVTVAPDG